MLASLTKRPRRTTNEHESSTDVPPNESVARRRTVLAMKRMSTTEPANTNAERPALRIIDRERNEVIEIAGDPKQIVKLVAYGVFAGCSEAFARVVARRTLGPSSLLPPLPPAPVNETADVMTADEVAEYLGVDRNTVYEYASRGAIPHKRLGKRMLFRRGSIIAWLDSAVVGSGR